MSKKTPRPRSVTNRRRSSAAAVRPTREQLQAAYGRRLPDVIAPGLKVLLVGINPSLYSAVVRHHFGRPGNRFWPALHRAGITDHPLEPGEQGELLAAGFGITNLVASATARADELDGNQLIAGGRRLRRKVERYRPRLVAFLGITTYRLAYDRPRAGLGRQAEKMADSEVWVLPNPSGLNAHYQLPDFARWFRRLQLRAELLEREAGVEG